MREREPQYGYVCARVYLQQLEDVVFVSVDEGLWGDPQGSICLIHGDNEGEDFSLSKNGNYNSEN